MKYLLFIISLIGQLLFATYLQAQQMPVSAGAESRALGHVRVSVDNVNNVLNNPSLLGQAKKIQFSANYQNLFSSSFLHAISATAQGVFFKGGWGVAWQRFGSALYSEHRLSWGYGHQLEGVSLGVSGQYLQMQAQGERSFGAFLANAGVMTRLYPKLALGAVFHNIFQAKAGENLSQQIPSFIAIGLLYQPYDKVRIHTEIEKELLSKVALKAGLAWEVLPALDLRAGFVTEPFLTSLGLGLRSGAFLIDYGVSLHPMLPLSHALSLSFSPQKNKKTHAQ
ncbi:hypothetical protein AAG747_18080 [Rapidithrix thailandica]|uniref:Uncharacterized protein n=1 Tax=Rapidithrix thailandica TaxID=413964 RepID=A0AAW9RY71_9BACT